MGFERGYSRDGKIQERLDEQVQEGRVQYADHLLVPFRDRGSASLISGSGLSIPSDSGLSIPSGSELSIPCFRLGAQHPLQPQGIASYVREYVCALCFMCQRGP